MKALKLVYVSIGFFILALVFVQCQKEELMVEDETQLTSVSDVRLPEEFDNNLSFPVIWSDGYILKLRESPINRPLLEGEWWYVWGYENPMPTEPICSCRPHPIRDYLCENGKIPGDGTSTVYKAYLQNNKYNIWQAGNQLPESSPLFVNLLDWSDPLETRYWDVNSKVPTELILYNNLDVPMLQYAMKHVTGFGTDEVHGLKTTLDDQLILEPGDIASVYSHNVRLTIQKLNVSKDAIPKGSLIWEPILGWTESDPNGDNIINEPIINYPVYETNEGPGYFHAKVNTGGKIVYEFVWDVSSLNEGEGFYRLTYSFDEESGEVPLNTYLDEAAQIIVPQEKRSPIHPYAGVAQLDIENNLTYMDICVKGTSMDH